MHTSPTAQPTTIVACAVELAELVCARRPVLTGRLQKALGLIDLGSGRAVYPQGQPDSYYVHAAARDGQCYLVHASAGTCTCKWGAHGDGSPCCHVLAARLLRAASNLQRARQRAADYRTPLAASYAAILAGLVA